MYQLKKTGIKALKILHLVAACCWVGGGVSMILLNLHNSAAVSEGMLEGINMASHIIDMWTVVAFGAMGCLGTGLIYGLFTPFGFFKHKWIMVKWFLTVTCILSGTFFLGQWESEMLELSAQFGNAALENPQYLTVKAKHLGLSFIQVPSLMVMVALSVIRPWGHGAGRGRNNAVKGN